MSCQEIQTWIDAYVDGELDLARSVQIEQHMTSCTACTHGYRELQAVRTSIGNNAASLYHRPSPLLQERLQTLVRQRDKPHTRPAIHRWSSMAAAFVLFVLAAVGLTRL